MTSAVIESEIPARPFVRTDTIVDTSYVKSIDTLSTTNAVILVLVAVLCCFMGFLFTLSESVQVWMPLMFLSVIVVLFVLFVIWHNTRGQYSLMSNVVPAFTAMVLVGFLALFTIAPAEGSWSISEPTENTFLYVAVALSFVLLAGYWMNADLRADLVRFNSGAFAAFVCFCLFFSSGMLYVGSLLDRAAKKWVKQGRIGSDLYPVVYWGLSGAIMLGLLLIDEVTSALINRVMGFGVESKGYRAASAELANATSRSKQMMLAIYAVLLFLPLGLVFWAKDGAVHPKDAPPQAFIAPIVTLGGLFPVLAMAGLGVNETRRFFPSAYRLIESLTGGLVFFVLATQFVPWENTQVLTLLGLCAFAYSIISIFGKQPSPFSIAIPMTALAVAVVTSDQRLPFALAAAAITAVWTIYNYRNSASTGAPAIMTAFVLVLALESLSGSSLGRDSPKEGALGLHVAIILPLLSIAVTLAQELRRANDKRLELGLAFGAGLLCSGLSALLDPELGTYFKEKQETAQEALRKVLPKMG